MRREKESHGKKNLMYIAKDLLEFHYLSEEMFTYRQYGMCRQGFGEIILGLRTNMSVKIQNALQKLVCSK